MFIYIRAVKINAIIMCYCNFLLTPQKNVDVRLMYACSMIWALGRSVVCSNNNRQNDDMALTQIVAQHSSSRKKAWYQSPDSSDKKQE